MSRQMRERINLGFVEAFAHKCRGRGPEQKWAFAAEFSRPSPRQGPRNSARNFGYGTLVAALSGLAALGCSDSAKGSLVTCDSPSGCGDVGATCSADAECASGNCAGGECVGAGPVTGGGGSGSGPSGPSGNGEGGSLVFVDDLDPSPGGAGAPGCIDLEVDFARVTPTVVLLIDQSSSMNEAFDNGVNRWDTLVNTLSNPQSSLLKKLEGSVRFGMALYSSRNGFGADLQNPSQCPLLTSVDIALGNFAAMSDVLTSNANDPIDDTPTAESVAAVAAQLEAFPEEGPKSIILATDGNPDTCEEPDSNEQESSKLLSVNAVTAAYGDGIPTHIISVGNETTASHLKDLAVAGAGGDPTAEAYTALDTDALADAFAEIIGSVRTCDFTLEGTVDAGDAASGTVILDGQTLAFGDPNGWEMPNPTTVRLLGDACEAIQADATGISMSFPCDAIQIIPR